MDFQNKIVTTFPLTELWNKDNLVKAERSSFLTKNELQELLKTQDLSFVVADVGKPLQWITESDKFSFWKSISNRLVETPDNINLDLFPDQYAFLASKWVADNRETIILLEKYH